MRRGRLTPLRLRPTARLCLLGAAVRAGLAQRPVVGVVARRASGLAPGLAPGRASGLAPGLAPGRASGLAPGLASGLAPRLACRMLAGLALGVLAGLAWGPADAASLPPVESTTGLVVAAQRLAAEAGVAMLRRGGNAVDAAVAVGYAEAVVNPCCGNIGGGGFLTAHLADGRDVFIDFRETAPAAARRDMYLDDKGRIIKGENFNCLSFGRSGHSRSTCLSCLIT